MKYKFPTINDISEVRTAISGRPNFIEVQKHDYIVFNYVVVTPDTFPKVEGWKNAMLRECRGLIFNLEGKCIRRPYHKFFNLGEREETLSDNIPVISKSDSVVLEKLDGSMIAPFYSNGKIRWGTKMGITDLTLQVENFVNERKEYNEYAEMILVENKTPIFEWCSNKNRIVLPFKQDKLVLTAVRNNTFGTYDSYEELVSQSKYFYIPVVNFLKSWSEESVREAKDSEGVVVRYNDGHCLKIKSDWYVDLHKTKEAIQSERNIIKMIFSNELDDVLPKLQEDDKEKVLKYQKEVFKAFDEYVWHADFMATRTIKQMDRKQFALTLKNNFSHDMQSFIFKRYDDPLLSQYQFFPDLILRKTGSNSNLKEVQHIYGYKKWDYNND